MVDSGILGRSKPVGSSIDSIDSNLVLHGYTLSAQTVLIKDYKRHTAWIW